MKFLSFREKSILTHGFGGSSPLLVGLLRCAGGQAANHRYDGVKLLTSCSWKTVGSSFCPSK